jgi:hypothetical protein
MHFMCNVCEASPQKLFLQLLVCMKLFLSSFVFFFQSDYDNRLLFLSVRSKDYSILKQIESQALYSGISDLGKYSPITSNNEH